MKQPVFIIAAILLIIVVLSVLQVVVSNGLSTTGIEVAKVQKEIDIVKKQNAVLKEEVLKQSSLVYIASEAATMGFIESKSMISVFAPLPLARTQ